MGPKAMRGKRGRQLGGTRPPFRADLHEHCSHRFVSCGQHRLISFPCFTSKALVEDYRKGRKEKKGPGRGSLVNDEKLSKV